MKYSRVLILFLLFMFSTKCYRLIALFNCKMAVVEKTSTSDNRTSPCQYYKFGIILNVIGLIILTCILVAIFVLVNVAKHHNEKAGHARHIFNSERKRHTLYRLVTRNEWIAQPPDHPLHNLILPVDRVIIGETQTEGCTHQSECVYLVRMIQMYHIESKHFDDIAYNFLIGGDGSVYEGRGWDKQGAHTKGYNSGSIGIALIGTFKRHRPPMRQFAELKLLLEEGVQLRKMSKDYKLYAQYAFTGTDSPGEKVINEIENWPHYVNKSFVEIYVCCCLFCVIFHLTPDYQNKVHLKFLADNDSEVNLNHFTLSKYTAKSHLFVNVRWWDEIFLQERIYRI